MLETLKPGEQRLVPYAVELAVRVLDNVDSHDDRIHRIVIRRGVLKAHYAQVEKTTYTFRNKSDSAQTVYLDHPRHNKDWKLVDTAEPHEITENYWRFRFPLPAQQTVAFVVQQRRTLYQSYTLTDVNDQQLTLWIDQRYLDDKTAEVLRQVTDLRQQTAGIEAQLQRLEAERTKIHAEQKRIRENLQALGDRSSEKDLRERFVRTLNTQEDRLEEIEKELRKQTAERDRCREQIDALLAKLEYETTV